jgi:NAD(P)-dependent dehydrogenase (short-subunit alcohol dehydrogenase family)
LVSELDLSHELVVISGGAGALGGYICARLADCGATVVSVDLAHPEGGQVENPPENVWRLHADISESTEVDRALDAVHDRYGRPPTTVCCHAGVVASYPILDYPLDEFDQLIRANVRGAFVLAQAAAKRWRNAGVAGHLIFTSSWVQDYPWPEIGPYCASKAALYSLMRSFAKELAPYRIRANAILPGIVSAGMARRQWDEDPAYRRRAQDAIALGELQDPNSVADAFAFLCSPMASYMTGSPLLVDGGCALRGP